MTHNDIALLEQADTRQAIEKNMDCDPSVVALSKQIKNAYLVASQVKYLQRAHTKLPSYYTARCILPALAFEQSSSEECAAHKEYGGELCIDLTCGLGVDSFYLSKRFAQVISIERDPILAQIARINFERLGVTNIRVENCTAEEFLTNFDAHADMIYVDPDRRGSGNRKLLLLEDCSPNVIALLPRMKEEADRIVIKNSPLFDVDEAFRLFGDRTHAEVVSLGGECKEVLITLDDSIQKPELKVTALGMASESFELAKPHISRIGKVMGSTYKYLIIPDVSLLKARRAVEYMSRYNDIYIESDNGYALSNTHYPTLMARIYEIESIEPYNPKSLKSSLKADKISKVDILKREFPEQTAEIAKKLGVSQGGRTKIAFTTFQNHRYVIRIK